MPHAIAVLVGLVLLAAVANAVVGAQTGRVRVEIGEGRNRDRAARKLQETESSVVQEAFDSDGVSLGYSHDEDTGWSEWQIGYTADEGHAPYKYHANASYYIVGSEGTLVEFWQPFDDNLGGKDMACVHLNVAATMVLKLRDANGTDTVRVKIVNAGWGGVASAPICNGEGCPALVLAGTTHMAYRYANGDALSLNSFLAQWASERGWVLTDDFIKYYFYDFNYDGNWIAIPLVSDTRVLAYNKTTFERYNIDVPPGVGETTRWSWEEFVSTAEVLTVSTGKPGWHFKGSWDEETKMSLMISRHWGTTLYENLDEDDTSDEGKVTCALGEDFVMAMNSTVEPMLRNGWMSSDFIPTDTDTFEEWLNTDLVEPPVLEEMNTQCCVDPAFEYNSTELWGMTIVPPGTLKEILDRDIGEAFVPGMYSFLGGSGLFISKKASKEQQEYGWELLKSMIDMASTYALVQRSPPPYDSVLVRDREWSTQEWELQVDQMRRSVPAQYPQPGLPQFLDLENSRPFRTMWMEMYYKGLNASHASERLVARLDEILDTSCKEGDSSNDNCRTCDADDYNHTVNGCEPATQTVRVDFAYDPQDGLCFGGIELHKSVNLACDHVETTSAFGVAIIVVSCAGGALAIGAAVLVYIYRERSVIRYSQPMFCVLFSLGVAGLCLSNLTMLGENTRHSCVSRVIVLGFAFDLAFGALFSKVYRVRRLFCDPTAGGRKSSRISYFPLIAVVALAVVVDIIIYSIWSTLGEPGPIETGVEAGESGVVVKMSQCVEQGSPWAITFIAFKVVLIAWGVYLAWVTRKINYTFVEGREISVSIYLFAVLAIILIFVGSAGVRVEFWALAKAFVFSLSSCTALMMVLGPKLWAAHKQMEVDISQLTSAEGSITSRSASMISSTVAAALDAEGKSFGSLGPGSSRSTVVCSHCHQETDASQVKRGLPGGGAFPSSKVGPWRGAQPRRTAKKYAIAHAPSYQLPRVLEDDDTRIDNRGNVTDAKDGRVWPQRLLGEGCISMDTCSAEADDARGPRQPADGRGSLNMGAHVLGSTGRGAMPPLPRRTLVSHRMPPAMVYPSFGGFAGNYVRDNTRTSSSSSNNSRCARAGSTEDGKVGDYELAFRNVDGGLGWYPASDVNQGASGPPRGPEGGTLAGVTARVPGGIRPAARNDETRGIGGRIHDRSNAAPPAAARRSWRPSWRPSSAANLSSTSVQSDMDAESFSRSLMAQAAALRAALFSSSSSKANDSIGTGAGTGGRRGNVAGRSTGPPSSIMNDAGRSSASGIAGRDSDHGGGTSTGPDVVDTGGFSRLMDVYPPQGESTFAYGHGGDGCNRGAAEEGARCPSSRKRRFRPFFDGSEAEPGATPADDALNNGTVLRRGSRGALPQHQHQHQQQLSPTCPRGSPEHGILRDSKLSEESIGMSSAEESPVYIAGSGTMDDAAASDTSPFHDPVAKTAARRGRFAPRKPWEDPDGGSGIAAPQRAGVNSSNSNASSFECPAVPARFKHRGKKMGGPFGNSSGSSQGLVSEFSAPTSGFSSGSTWDVERSPRADQFRRLTSGSDGHGGVAAAVIASRDRGGSMLSFTGSDDSASSDTTGGSGSLMDAHGADVDRASGASTPASREPQTPPPFQEETPGNGCDAGVSRRPISVQRVRRRSGSSDHADVTCQGWMWSSSPTRREATARAATEVDPRAIPAPSSGDPVALAAGVVGVQSSTTADGVCRAGAHEVWPPELAE